METGGGAGAEADKKRLEVRPPVPELLAGTALPDGVLIHVASFLDPPTFRLVATKDDVGCCNQSSYTWLTLRSSSSLPEVPGFIECEVKGDGQRFTVGRNKGIEDIRKRADFVVPFSTGTAAVSNNHLIFHISRVPETGLYRVKIEDGDGKLKGSSFGTAVITAGGVRRDIPPRKMDTECLCIGDAVHLASDRDKQEVVDLDEAQSIRFIVDAEQNINVY